MAKKASKSSRVRERTDKVIVLGLTLVPNRCVVDPKEKRGPHLIREICPPRPLNKI